MGDEIINEKDEDRRLDKKIKAWLKFHDQILPNDSLRADYYRLHEQ